MVIVDTEEQGVTQKLVFKTIASPVNRGKLQAQELRYFECGVSKASWLELRTLRHRDERRSGVSTAGSGNPANAFERWYFDVS